MGAGSIEAVLRERYADEKNAVLAAELGVSVRTVERWAGRLGLRKSAAFRRRCGVEGGRKGCLVGGFAKARFKGDAPWRWKKGHRWSAEVEARRVRALRDAAWEERKRTLHGEKHERWRKQFGEDLDFGESFCRFAGNMEKVRVKKLVPEAVMPRRAHKSDAGFDLVAVSGGWVEKERLYVYHTGLAFEIPEGYVGLVFPRSSVAKKDLILSNCVGVIDAGYRGEVTAKFAMAGRPEVGGDVVYHAGDRIAQIVIVKLPDVELIESEGLSESERGAGGYGSTGK